MTKFKFWNEVCKYGAIIGLVMSVAFVIEQSLMLSGWFSTMGLVWVLAAVVYIVLLYRFAKRRREQVTVTGFFWHGLGFILALILASAMIKGGRIPLLHITGYSEYIDRYTSALIRSAEEGKFPASMEGVFAEMLKTIQEASEPSIQATVGASIWGNLIVGLVLGLILAGKSGRVHPGLSVLNPKSKRTMDATLDISVVVLYNEEESLPELVEWIDRVARGEGLSYEVILVDDGSGDGSWRGSKINERGHAQIKFARNYGKSAALYCGFAEARGEVVFTMDADWQGLAG